MQVYITDSAFFNLVIAAVEVWPKECLGLLLGFKGQKEFMIELAPVYQTADRKHKEVRYPHTKIEERVASLIQRNFPYGEIIGDFHSHPYKRVLYKNGYFLSKPDKTVMEEKKIYLITEIVPRGSIPWSLWEYRSDRTLSGSAGDFFLKIAAWYRIRDTFEMARIICPAATGFGYEY